MIKNSLATFTTDLKAQDDICDMIDTRDGAFWVNVGDADGTVDGFVTFGSFRAGPGYAATVEHTVIVADSARRRGVGAALMQNAQRNARRNGARTMVAAISSANPHAVSFHARLGFRQTGHMPKVGYKADRWLDLILMQKTLCAP